MTRNVVRARMLTTAMALALLGATACRSSAPKPSEPAAALETALFPMGFASRLVNLGRAHVHDVSQMSATVDGGDTETVTTDTDVWSDETGNFRVVEVNDRDGGREIVRYGKQLAVALRYGKLIKRAAIAPEPANLLAEALSAPFAFLDLARAGAIVDDMGEEKLASGRPAKIYKLSLQPKQYFDVLADAKGTRDWRRTIVLDELQGTVKVDVATRVPVEGVLHAAYRMRRGGDTKGADSKKADSKRADSKDASNGVPMHGRFDVKLLTSDIGSSPEIAPPEAEEVPPRQRTVQEEKTLLGGIASRALPVRGSVKKEKP